MLLAALVLMTVQLGAVRAAHGLGCSRTAPHVASESDGSAAPSAVTTVHADHLPESVVAAGCPASSWLPEARSAATPDLPEDASALAGEAGPGPDPSLRLPFHPPRSV